MNSPADSLAQNIPTPAESPAPRRSRGMNFGQILQIAWRAIIANTTRSILTALGVIIGVSAVVALTSLGSGATGSISKQFEGLGTNLLTVSSGQASKDRGPNIVQTTSQQTITMGDVQALQDLQHSGSDIAGIAPTVQSNMQAKFAASNMNVSVTGTWPAYETVRNSAVKRGNWFTQSDVTLRKRVAVIGSQVASDLFGNANPLDKSLKLNGISFTVVGIMPDKGNSGFGSPNTQVFVPLSSYQQRLGNQLGSTGEATVQSVSVAARDQKTLKDLQSRLSDLLAQRHKKATPDSYDFNVANQADALSSISQVTAILTLFLGGVAGISLLVGGIGIMNIMLVSVTERTREIGIRKALGAKPHDILLQFLIEAFVLSVGGGIMGIVLGLLMAYGVGAAIKITPIVGASSIVLAFVFSAAVGIFFGYYPASRAAQLDPVDSLRYE
jgi:putative ABC transport system permease protein